MARNFSVFSRTITAGQGASALLGLERIPSWNAAGRPKKAREGIFGFNSQTKNLEYWNGSVWLKLRMKKI